MIFKKMKVFVAAPNDVNEEVDKACMVISKVNKIFGDLFSIHLEVHRGKEAAPSMGRPQGEILKQFRFKDYDYFIGILWTRFGSAPGATKHNSSDTYSSGTEEEFYEAYELYKNHKRPQIMIYHCKRQPEYDSIDPQQLMKVKKFFKKFEPDGEHPGLYHQYNDIKQFEEDLFEHLFIYLRQSAQEFTGQKTSELTNVTDETGFKNIYFPANNDERNKAKKESLLIANNINLIAFTGHSYMGQHGHKFRHEVIARLDKGAVFKLLLVDQYSDIGNKIAFAELNLPQNTNTDLDNIGILKATSGHSISYRDTLMGYDELKTKYDKQLELRFTREIITATVLLTENECFYEPYIYFDFQERMRRAMTTFEIRVGKYSSLYTMMNNMFTEYWNRGRAYSSLKDKYSST